MIALTSTQGLDSHTSAAAFTRPGGSNADLGAATAGSSNMGYTDSRTLGGQGRTPRYSGQGQGINLTQPAQFGGSSVTDSAAYGEHLVSKGQGSKSAPVEEDNRNSGNTTSHFYQTGSTDQDLYKVPRGNDGDDQS